MFHPVHQVLQGVEGLKLATLVGVQVMPQQVLALGHQVVVEDAI